MDGPLKLLLKCHLGISEDEDDVSDEDKLGEDLLVRFPRSNVTTEALRFIYDFFQAGGFKVPKTGLKVSDITFLIILEKLI